MADEEKLVEAMARAMKPSAFATYDGGYTCQNAIDQRRFLNAEKSVKVARRAARAALAAAREAGCELIQETELTELRRALSEAESSVDYYYENYTE